MFTCDEKTLRRHDSTYCTISDVKDVDPDVLQGVLNFIETNTQVEGQIDVPEDVKQDMGVLSTGTEVIDEMRSLRALNKVSFGIREQCKLITDLSYQMDDVTCGETILENLTDLYKHMYDRCRKDACVVPLREDHLKFTVLGGRKRKRGLFRGRRIVPLYPTKTAKARQAKQSRFGRKANSCVTETTIAEMMGQKGSDDNDNETPMEVSDEDGDVVPFVDLASYKGQDEIREKVLTTPGVLEWLCIHCQVQSFHFTWPYIIFFS